MAQLKQFVRKSPQTTNLLQEKFQTFLIQHDLLPQTISNEAQIIHLDSTNNTTTSAPIYELGKQLLNAAKTGNINEIKSLMGRGAAFTPDWLGACPLHYAASNGHVQACEVLLRAGISRNSRTKVDRTPLHMAVYEGHIDVVKSLIKHGADVNARDMLLMTPLQWAVQRCDSNNARDIDMVKCLLSNGAKAAAENKFGNTALDIALQLGNSAVAQLVQAAALAQQQRADQLDDAPGADTGQARVVVVDHSEANEYLNDVVRLSPNPVEVVATADQQVTIEDCVDEEDNTASEPIAPMLIDNGYCSSTSVDQQQQHATDAHSEAAPDESAPQVTQNIDLTVDDSVVDVDAVDDPYRLLSQRYGIELLPETEEDGGRILKHAMDSGHSFSLTEAGKRALKAFKLQADPQPDSTEQLSSSQQGMATLQLVRTTSSASCAKVQQPLINQLTTNSITNTSKRKRIFTSASNLSSKKPPQIVFLQNASSNNVRGKVAEGSLRVGTTRPLLELVGAPTARAPAAALGAESTAGASHALVHPNKQMRQHSQQQETTLFTLTAAEFAGLQANGGLITTNNGIYRLMDYNHSPANVVRQKRPRIGDIGNVASPDSNAAVVQAAEVIKQRQQESDAVRALRQQLQEQRHLVDLYKRKYLKKEAEAERFKQQLKLMLKHRSSNKNLSGDVIYNIDETNSR